MAADETDVPANEGKVVKLKVLTSTQAETIESMAESGEVLDPYQEVAGSQPQMSFDVYHEDFQVTRSVARLGMPSEIPVEGQFQMGDLVKFEIIGRVDDVFFRSIKDKHGNRLGVKRQHIVPITVWRRVDYDPLAEK